MPPFARRRSLPLLAQKAPDYVFAPFAYHDSWLSIDPIVGCRYSCGYCYMQQTAWTGVQPERILTVDEVIGSLLAGHVRHFVPHATVLSFGSHTDAFLPENVPFFTDLVSGLDAAGLHNALTVVTKSIIPESVVALALGARSLRVRFIVSYSGLDKRVEKGVNPFHALANLRMLREAGLPAIHFWRPLMSHNSTDAALRSVLMNVARFAAASVYVGLKLTPQLLDVYRSTVPYAAPRADTEYGEHLPEGVERRLRSLARTLFPDYPLYRHTSCALSLVLGQPDYNATMYRPSICLEASRCPTAQRQLCAASKRSPGRDEVRKRLDDLGYHGSFLVTDEGVELADEIAQDDYTSLIHSLGVPIAAQVVRVRNVWGNVVQQFAGQPCP